MGILDGQKSGDKTPYTGLAICDLTKLGTYNPLLGLASLFTDPSITRLMPKERIKPKIETRRDEGGLLDHVLVAGERVKKGENEFLANIDP